MTTTVKTHYITNLERCVIDGGTAVAVLEDRCGWCGKIPTTWPEEALLADLLEVLLATPAFDFAVFSDELLDRLVNYIDARPNAPRQQQLDGFASLLASTQIAFAALQIAGSRTGE
jgi:hypothetical protein